MPEKLELKGRLEFISFFHPIKLFLDTGEIDLRDQWLGLFERLNGKKAIMKEEIDFIEICAEEKSDSVIKFESDSEGILILLKGESYTSNIGAYLPNTLQRLNGRKVIVSITEDGIKICNDPKEKVFGVYFTGDGNSSKIPENKIKDICKPGTENCCIFLVMGSSGFECKKFDSPTARHLLDRYSKKEMVANRIGDCKNLGRKD